MRGMPWLTLEDQCQNATVLLDSIVLISLDLQALVTEGGIHISLFDHIVVLQWDLGTWIYRVGYLLV